MTRAINMKRYFVELHLRGGDLDPANIAMTEQIAEAKYQEQLNLLRPGDRIPSRTQSDTAAWAKHLSAQLDALMSRRISPPTDC